MADRSRIAMLPAKVRVQLNRRLIAANFGGIVATTAWLQQHGHAIGKSAVGVYAKRLACQQKDDAAAKRLGKRAPAVAAIRLACLQVAAPMGGSVAATLKRAEALAAWVNTSGAAPVAAVSPTGRE